MLALVPLHLSQNEFAVVDLYAIKIWGEEKKDKNKKLIKTGPLYKFSERIVLDNYEKKCLLSPV